MWNNTVKGRFRHILTLICSLRATVPRLEAGSLERWDLNNGGVESQAGALGAGLVLTFCISYRLAVGRKQ